MATCVACGTVLSSDGAACPTCGFSSSLPDPPAVSLASPAAPLASTAVPAAPLASPAVPLAQTASSPAPPQPGTQYAPAAPPPPWATAPAAAAGTAASVASSLWLVIVGAGVVALTTVVEWTLQLSPAMMWGPTLSATYWTGLAPSSLRGIPTLDLTLYLSDVAVTVLCAVAAVLALRALSSQARLPRGLVIAVGCIAIAVFVTEGVRWLFEGSVVLVLGLSIAGAALVVIGAARLPRS